MYYVYVLQGETGNLYTGYSSDLKKRVAKHKSGGNKTTKKMGKINLIFYEAFKSKRDAIRRELYLKSTKGKRALRIMLKYSL